MTEEEVTALAMWLKQSLGIELDPERLRDPAAAAAKFGALAGRAARDLPFGAEPSGFDLATAELREGGDGDAG